MISSSEVVLMYFSCLSTVLITKLRFFVVILFVHFFKNHKHCQQHNFCQLSIRYIFKRTGWWPSINSTYCFWSERGKLETLKVLALLQNLFTLVFLKKKKKYSWKTGIISVDMLLPWPMKLLLPSLWEKLRILAFSCVWCCDMVLSSVCITILVTANTKWRLFSPLLWAWLEQEKQWDDPN